MKNFILFGLVGLAGFALGVTATGISLGFDSAKGVYYAETVTRDGRIVTMGTPLKRSTEEEETSE